MNLNEHSKLLSSPEELQACLSQSPSYNHLLERLWQVERHYQERCQVCDDASERARVETLWDLDGELYFNGLQHQAALEVHRQGYTEWAIEEKHEYEFLRGIKAAFHNKKAVMDFHQTAFLSDEQIHNQHDPRLKALTMSTDHGWGIEMASTAAAALRTGHSAEKTMDIWLDDRQCTLELVRQACEAVYAEHGEVEKNTVVKYLNDQAHNLRVEPPSFMQQDIGQLKAKQYDFCAMLIVSCDSFRASPTTATHLHRYSVPDRDNLLQWDEPLSQQPDGIQAPFLNKNKALGKNARRTGGEMYMELAASLGSERAASEFLLKYGIQGTQYRVFNDHSLAPTEHLVLWDPRSVDLETIDGHFAPAKAIQLHQTEKRAGIRFGCGRFADIYLHENCSTTSFIHESAHLFLEMYSDASQAEQSTRALKSEYKQLLKWFGLTDKQWQSMSLKEREPYHEKFSYAFEKHVANEVVTLTQAHDTYADWLIDAHEMSVDAEQCEQPPQAITELMQSLTSLGHGRHDANTQMLEEVFEKTYQTSRDSGMNERIASIHAGVMSSAYVRFYEHAHLSPNDFLRRYGVGLHVTPKEHSGSEAVCEAVGHDYGHSTSLHEFDVDDLTFGSQTNNLSI